MVTARQLVEKRRYFIVAAFILAAIVTPPEVVSQLALVISVLALYEAVIAALRWVESGR